MYVQLRRRRLFAVCLKFERDVDGNYCTGTRVQCLSSSFKLQASSGDLKMKMTVYLTCMISVPLSTTVLHTCIEQDTLTATCQSLHRLRHQRQTLRIHPLPPTKNDCVRQDENKIDG